MTFKDVPNKVDFPEQERETLAFWKNTRAFDKLRELHRQDPPWQFIDGPITANNPMGVHHGWGRTYKDLYHRFWTMRGHQLRYQNGFDCHREGDRALAEAARSLRDVCRGSDIVARLGGDEFAAMVLEAPEGLGAGVVGRLQERIAEVNAAAGRPYVLSMSLGVERYLPGSGIGIDELIRRADARMYATKKTRKP
jgi:hypothetical protein